MNTKLNEARLNEPKRNELNTLEGRLTPEENHSKRNLASQPAPLTDNQPQPDEISVQLSFRFTCGNSFKVLIGVGLCLAIGWNIYTTFNQRPLPSQVPTLPQPPNLSKQ